MQNDYSWAANKEKLHRALIVYPENEQKCKEMYIALGGLVLGETSATVEYPNMTQAPSTTAPEAKIEPVVQEKQKDVDLPVSKFQCKECPFIGKNDKSLALHFRKKHAK